MLEFVRKKKNNMQKYIDAATVQWGEDLAGWFLIIL